MSAPKISLCMIVKDEEENLGACLESARPHVDEVVVADTGSTDRTREIARGFGGLVVDVSPATHPGAFFVDSEEVCKVWSAPGAYSGEVALCDFAAARNVSFGRATGDYILWLDADDVLEGGERLREVVADLASRRLDYGFLAYEYARDDKGRTFYRQWRERIVRRGSAVWVNPVHEVLLPSAPIQVERYSQVQVVHRRKADRKQIAHRNYKILLKQYWEIKNGKSANGIVIDGQVDPRTLFYLGQEARFVEPVRAAGFYEEYLTRSGWPEERAAAHVALGSLLEFAQLPVTQEQALARADLHYSAAAAEHPENPDGLLGLARVAYLRKRWQDCVGYSQRGLAIGNTDTMLGTNPMDRLYRPHIYLNHALAQLGRVEEAIESCRAGLSVAPDDPGVPGGAPGMLKHNLAIYERDLAARRAGQVPAASAGEQMVAALGLDDDLESPPHPGIPGAALLIWVQQIWKHAVAANDGARAMAVLDSAPISICGDPMIGRMRAATVRRFFSHDPAHSLPPPARRAPEGKLEVVIWTGPAFEAWDPETPETRGIGGSETAAIEMGKNLSLLGHAVTVWGDCPDRQGVYDGVHYRHWQSFTGADCDVFISSRAPGIAEAAGKIKARLKLLWVHDIHCGPPSPQMERWLLWFDRVLCLSEWHRNYFASVYPTLDPARVLVTRNGIDPERFSLERLRCGACGGGHAGPSPCPVCKDVQLGEKRNHLVFSSSPNRGLDGLLHNFQFVRAQVPDAELHVYYGFDCWETMARNANNQQELTEIQRYKDLLQQATARGGVTWHGRRPQREVAEAFLRAKVWAYPTAFTETYCISALEAQAAGCLPVTTKLAALAETVKHGVLLDPGPKYGEQWVRAVVGALTDEGWRSKIAIPGREWALTQSWAALAREWVGMFEGLIAEVRARPVPAWKEVG